MRQENVALIVVHGVADQAAGATSEALKHLMVGGALGDTHYRVESTDGFTISVDPLQPWAGSDRREPPTPFSEDRSALKAFQQSWKPGLGADAQSHQANDPGLQVTDYLLRKHFENGGVREPYSSERTCLLRSVEGVTTHRLDMFEMYWADLSRLSNKVPRIVAEVFTLMFRFSRLGRDAVALGRSADRQSSFWWGLTSGLQTLLDWLLVYYLSTVTLLLVMTGVSILLAGALLNDRSGHVDILIQLVPGFVGTLAGLLLLYRLGAPSGPNLAYPALLLSLAGLQQAALWLGGFEQGTGWSVVAVILGLLTIVVMKGLKVADDRFPFVKAVGTTLWVAAMGLMVWHAGDYCHASLVCDQRAPLEGLLLGAIQVVDLLLYYLFKLPWTYLIPAAMSVWLVSGLVATWSGSHAERATVATGRLGATVSLSAFLAVVMIVWAMASKALPAAAGGMQFQSKYFESVTGLTTASDYLRTRFEASTAGFGLLVLVLSLLLLYLVVAMVPSILAELLLLVDRKRRAVKRQALERYDAMHALRSSASSARATEACSQAQREQRTDRARQLGRWLTRFYRRLDLVTLFISGAAVAFAIYLATLLHRDDDIGHLQSWARGLLTPLAIGATGFMAFLVAFGGLLSRYAPTLRAPLDIALDVDNHFREFPRDQIPRARIFSRYAALLEKIAAGGYDRLVIVAHSQGTVLTAELLRYLSAANGAAASPPTLASGAQLPPISLLTLGSPLRQLYASRFPLLYGWVLQKDKGNICGPKTEDVGVQRWFNAYCSGDYVGRWLWSDHRQPADNDHAQQASGNASDGRRRPKPRLPRDVQPLPTSDTARSESYFDRDDAYALMDIPLQDQAHLEALALQSRAETCLGVGAHTHYFDPGQDAVAWLVDQLVLLENIEQSHSLDRPVTEVGQLGSAARREA